MNELVNVVDANGEVTALTPAVAVDFVLRDLQTKYLETPSLETARDLGRALKALYANLQTPEQIQTARARAKSIQEMMQAIGARLIEQNEIADARLHLERDAGAWLGENVRAGNPILTPQENWRLPHNISANQSYDWRRLCEIPDADFEQYIENCKEEQREITTRGALGVWMKLNRAPLPFEDTSGSNGHDAGEQADAANVPPIPDTPEYGETRTVYLTCPMCEHEDVADAFAKRVEQD